MVKGLHQRRYESVCVGYEGIRLFLRIYPGQRAQNKYFWYAKNGEPRFFRILDGATVPSAIRGTFKGKWNLFINRFKSNSYICDTMHPVFTPEAQAILMKPLLEAYRSGRVKHIDDFDLLRLSPSHQNENKTKEE